MNRPDQIKNLDYLKNRRRKLRKTLTTAEAALWKVLQGKQVFGLKFRRQTSIENYIVDFFCPSLRLIIELDGEVHNNVSQAQYDLERDKRLDELKYKVLRFENRIVFENPEVIIEAIKSKLTTTPYPS